MSSRARPLTSTSSLERPRWARGALGGPFPALGGALLTPCLPQIEDLSQQVHKAAAEKFKVPLEHSALVTDAAPALAIKEESEEEEEVSAGGLWDPRGCCEGLTVL